MGRSPLAAVLAGILLGAFLLRIGVMVYYRSFDIPSDADHWAFGFETGRLARSLATGAGFSSPMPEPSGASALLPPGYPLLLAGIFKLFGVYTTASAVAAFVLNSLFSALTCLGLYRLGERLFGSRAGLAAAAVFALYPPSVYHAVSTIWDTTLLAFLLVALMNRLYGMPPRPAAGQLAATGLLMGLIALVNPAPATFYPAIAFVVWRRARNQGLSGFKAVALLTASCFLLCLPWLVRNAIQVGVFALRGTSGLNLRLGNNESAWRAGTGLADFSKHPNHSREEGEIFHQLGEVEYDRRCARLATRFIRENPEKFASLTLMRMRAWWLGAKASESSGNLRLTFPVSALKRLMFIAPLPLFLVGCLAARRRRKPIGLLLALIIIYPIPYYFIIVLQRYRFPIEPFLLLIAAYGLTAIPTWRRADTEAATQRSF